MDESRRQLSASATTQQEVKRLREQMEAAQEVKRKTQTMAAPLRAKVLRLSQQCKARDELIRRLSSQLQRYERDSDVVLAADKVVQASTDYSRPISPMTSQFLTDLEVCSSNLDIAPVRILSSNIFLVVCRRKLKRRRCRFRLECSTHHRFRLAAEVATTPTSSTPNISDAPPPQKLTPYPGKARPTSSRKHLLRHRTCSKQAEHLLRSFRMTQVRHDAVCWLEASSERRERTTRAPTPRKMAPDATRN